MNVPTDREMRRIRTWGPIGAATLGLVGLGLAEVVGVRWLWFLGFVIGWAAGLGLAWFLVRHPGRDDNAKSGR